MLVTCSLVLVAQLLTAAFAFSLRPNAETNDINSYPEADLYRDLPVCRGPSACAFLQANTRGISVQPFCQCTGSHKCPATWDSRDGHSLTQGSDQYKFCHRVPEDVGRCSPVEMAYTTMMEFSKTTNEMDGFSGHIHCSCPDHHVYEFFDMQTQETRSHEILTSTFTCQKLKTCEPSDSCREVTETSSSFLIKDVCSCPHGLRCPSNPHAAYDSEQLGAGTIYLIRCQ